MAWLADDALPFLDPYTGTELFAAAFGCRVATPDSDMPFAVPMVRTAAEASKLRGADLDAAPLRLVFEIADELRRRGGDEALMALPDIQSPMDIAALIWDKTDLFCAMATAPRAVTDLAAKTRQLLTDFLDEWFARYGPELIGHYPHDYFPRGVTVSEDEIGSVSEAMFDEFFLPSLCHLADRYGGLGIHCCAAARHQWPGLKSIEGLRLMNICQPPETARAAHVFFSPEIVHHHYGWTPDGPPQTWVRQLPPDARVVLELHEDDREKSVELAEALNAAREPD
jgi:uroporphyrinogen-III decarboxylase